MAVVLYAPAKCDVDAELCSTIASLYEVKNSTKVATNVARTLVFAASRLFSTLALNISLTHPLADRPPRHQLEVAAQFTQDRKSRQPFV